MAQPVYLFTVFFLLNIPAHYAVYNTVYSCAVNVYFIFYLQHIIALSKSVGMAEPFQIYCTFYFAENVQVNDIAQAIRIGIYFLNVCR